MRDIKQKFKIISYLLKFYNYAELKEPIKMGMSILLVCINKQFLIFISNEEMDRYVENLIK